MALFLTAPLSSLQSMFYLSGKNDIYSAEGYRLETIGYGIKRDDIEGGVYRLKEQIYIQESILGHSLELQLAGRVGIGGPVIPDTEILSRLY